MNTLQKIAAGGALVGGALLGGAVGASFMGVAGAQDSGSSTTAPAATAPAAPDSGQANQGQAPQGQAPQGQAPDPSKGGHQANGITEELLTGDAATKAEAAAEAAVPGGTVQRVENDAEGATYEAHVTTSDNKQVTVKMDDSFKVTSVEEGMR